jgi:hypothetical protein
VERPQLLFSSDGPEPTQAFFAVFVNDFSMNFALPLGTARAARSLTWTPTPWDPRLKSQLMLSHNMSA